MTLVLADHPPTLLAFLCLLDLEHGVPFGFVTVALAAHLAAQGADAASIGGLIAMAMLPWSFKWAWGPVVYSGCWAALGRRRPGDRLLPGWGSVASAPPLPRQPSPGVVGVASGFVPDDPGADAAAWPAGSGSTAASAAHRQAPAPPVVIDATTWH